MSVQVPGGKVLLAKIATAAQAFFNAPGPEQIDAKPAFSQNDLWLIYLYSLGGILNNISFGLDFVAQLI